MDTAAIALTVQQLTPYLQEYGPIFAAKAVEAIAEKVPDAVGKLWGSIKAKFDAEGAAKSALEKLLNDPQDEKFKNVVEYHLEEYLKNDAAFAEKISALLKEAQAAAPVGANYQAYAADGAAIAQGENAKAVGKGGILIEGGVKGDFTVGSEKKKGK
jgi:hypothetical protein